MAAQQQKQNYQRILEHTLEEIGKNGAVPTLLLHSCCAPCSSYVLEYLSQYFEITVFYYNPNIYPETEYRERAREQERLICEMKTENPIHFLEGTYDPSVFYAMAKGHEKDPEGGERCFRCYELRLREGAAAAKQGGFDYFTTTLSISPLKNAQKLNEKNMAFPTCSRTLKRRMAISVLPSFLPSTAFTARTTAAVYFLSKGKINLKNSNLT